MRDDYDTHYRGESDLMKRKKEIAEGQQGIEDSLFFEGWNR
jgi:hypothetical protein